MNRINKDLSEFETALPTSATCPHCNTKLDLTTGISGNNPEARKPMPGDVSVCCKCGEVCQFGSDMTMVKIPEAVRKNIMEDPMIKRLAELIKEGGKSGVTSKYIKQMDIMRESVLEWLKQGNKNPSIQYNFTEKSFIIVSLEDALEKHVISVNDDAMSMFKELGWLDDKSAMPTIMMVKTVMESLFKEDK